MVILPGNVSAMRQHLTSTAHVERCSTDRAIKTGLARLGTGDQAGEWRTGRHDKHQELRASPGHLNFGDGELQACRRLPSRCDPVACAAVPRLGQRCARRPRQRNSETGGDPKDRMGWRGMGIGRRIDQSVVLTINPIGALGSFGWFADCGVRLCYWASRIARRVNTGS